MLFDFISTLDNNLVQFKPWVFEKDAPASNKTIREIYLDALKNSGLYIGLFGNEYDEYTIDEFDKVTEWNIPRHIYIKDVDYPFDTRKKMQKRCKSIIISFETQLSSFLVLKVLFCLIY